jgi:hypothetical protein
MQSPEATLKQVRRDIIAWRRIHRRGPLPAELRQRAGIVAQFLGESAVAEALELDVMVIAGWAERYGAAQADADKADEGPAFVDIGRQLATAIGGAAAPTAGAGWCVEVTKPCGTAIRLQGPFNAALLEAVVRGAAATR